MECPNLPANIQLTDKHLVVFTVVDAIKHYQIFRFDRKRENLLIDGLLLPGINAYMIIVVTVCVRNEDGLYYAQFQGQLVLRDIQNYFSKRVYRISLYKSFPVRLYLVVFFFSCF